MALALCLVAALEPAASMQTSQCVPEGVEPVLTGPEPPMVLQIEDLVTKNEGVTENATQLDQGVQSKHSYHSVTL